MFNNNGESKMFNKKKEQKKVWLVIEKNTYGYTNNETFTVSKKAYSLDDAIGFKVALDKLNDRENQSYFIATDVESATNEVIRLHNQKVANDNK
jgi:type IV secretory pathway VirJ component